MKGILLENVGGTYKLVEDIAKPTPASHQILVKSLVTAINPVEGYMQSTGIMVTSWPIVLGCDASGTVVKIGDGVKKFKVGDRVFGCTALGVPGHSPFQEYFLMNEDLAFKKPDNLTTKDAATVGVGLLTACLGLNIGTNIELKARTGDTKGEWVTVLGAAGSVGQFAVQVAKLCGYRVLASCSPSNNEMVTKIGADATFDYKLPLTDQLTQIADITRGDFSRVFDASAMSTDTGIEALAQKSNKDVKIKYFATTNDWMPIESKDGVEVYKVTLGDIGREGNERVKKVNKDIAKMIPKLEEFLEAGLLKPLEYVQVGDVGVGEILKGLDAFATHKSGKKIIVSVAEN